MDWFEKLKSTKWTYYIYKKYRFVKNTISQIGWNVFNETSWNQWAKQQKSTHNLKNKFNFYFLESKLIGITS